MFPNIEQEVVVFIGEKGGEEKGIRIFEMNNLDDFDTLDLSQNGFKNFNMLKKSGQSILYLQKKWNSSIL